MCVCVNGNEKMEECVTPCVTLKYEKLTNLTKPNLSKRPSYTFSPKKVVPSIYSLWYYKRYVISFPASLPVIYSLTCNISSSPFSVPHWIHRAEVIAIYLNTNTTSSVIRSCSCKTEFSTRQQKGREDEGKQGKGRRRV